MSQYHTRLRLRHFNHHPHFPGLHKPDNLKLYHRLSEHLLMGMPWRDRTLPSPASNPSVSLVEEPSSAGGSGMICLLMSMDFWVYVKTDLSVHSINWTFSDLDNQDQINLNGRRSILHPPLSPSKISSPVSRRRVKRQRSWCLRWGCVYCGNFISQGNSF